MLHSCLALLYEKRFTKPSPQETNIHDSHLHAEGRTNSAPETGKEQQQLVKVTRQGHGRARDGVEGPPRGPPCCPGKTLKRA